MEFSVTAALLDSSATFIPLHGKRPVTSGWGSFLAQKLEKDERAALLGDHTGNRGLLTGHDRIELPGGAGWVGVCVIDVDVKPGQRGQETLSALSASLGELPDTLTARTPSGGLHLYFLMPRAFDDAPRTALGPGIDFQNEGEQVVFCGEITTGEYPGRYEWVDASVPVAEIPASWVVHILRAKSKAPRDGTQIEASMPPIDIASEDGKLVVDEAIRWCMEAAPVAVKGQRGQTALLEVAGHLIKRFRLPREVAKALIVEAWSPRCDPPSCWRDENIERKLDEAQSGRCLFPEWGPGWSENKMEQVGQKMRATAKGLRPGVIPTRRQRNAHHVYSFVPGRDVLKLDDDPKSALVVDVANKLATHPDWIGCLQWDEFRSRVIAVDPPLKMDAEQGRISDDDVSHVRQWLSCNGMVLSEGDCMAAIRTAARRVSFHSIREYLESCRGKGRGLLGGLAERLFGNPGKYPGLFLEKFLVSAVRRALWPGCRVDTVLVLVGPQGARKTTFVQMLFGDEFTRTQMPSLENKDASSALAEFWGVELGEFHRVMKADKDSVKEFLTRTYDDYRPAYGKCDIRQARRVVFIGTSNSKEVLADATGDRRYWPLEVNKVDIEYLREHRDEIWGEALELAEDETYQHWFENENEEELKGAKEEFTLDDPWHDLIEDYLLGKDRVAVGDIFTDAISRGNADLTKLDTRVQMRIADVLRKVGCVKAKSHGRVVWKTPSRIADAPVARVTASQRLAASKPS